MKTRIIKPVKKIKKLPPDTSAIGKQTLTKISLPDVDEDMPLVITKKMLEDIIEAIFVTIDDIYERKDRVINENLSKNDVKNIITEVMKEKFTE